MSHARKGASECSKSGIRGIKVFLGMTSADAGVIGSGGVGERSLHSGGPRYCASSPLPHAFFLPFVLSAATLILSDSV